MIKSINTLGLKGAGLADYVLGKITHIHGRNGKGKTKIYDAIQLACLGYKPGRGKTNKDCFDYSCGERMETGVVFGDDTGVKRVWEKKGRSVSASVQPEDFQLDPMLELVLNNDLYFVEKKSDKAKIDYVISLFREGTVSVEQVFAEFKTISFKGFSEDHQILLNEIIGEVQEIEEAESVQDWLDRVVASVKEELKETNNSISVCKKTIEGLADMKAEDEIDLDNINVAELEKEISVIVEEINRLNQVCGECHAIISQAKGHSDVLEHEQNRLKEVFLTPRGEIDSLGQKCNDLKAKVEVLNKKRDEASAAIAEVERKLVDHRSTNDKIDDGLTAAESLINNINSEEECPHCGSNHEGWRNKVIENAKKTIEGLNASMRGTLALIKPLEKEFNEWREEERKLSAEYNAVQQNLESSLNELNYKVQQNQQHESITRRIKEVEEALGKKDKDVEKRNQEAIEQREIAVEKHKRKSAYLKKVNAVHNDQKRISQAEKELLENEAKKKIYTAMGKVADEQKKKVVQQAFDSCLGLANKLVAGVGIFEKPIEYRNGVLGVEQEGEFVSYKTFSGSETSLLYNAIVLGLTNKSKNRIVFIDEFDRLDDINKSLLIENAKGMIDDKLLDQCILIGVNECDNSLIDAAIKL